MIVRGTIRNAVPGQRVIVTVKARAGRRTRTLRTTAPLRAGRFTATTRLASARWRVTTATAYVPGNSWYEPGRSVRRLPRR